MKANYIIWLILTVFYAVVTAGYYVWWTLTYTGWEPIGTSALAMLTFMSAFLTFYIWKVDRTQGVVPEDRADGNIEDGESELGFFMPWSWWPIYLGIASALVFASLAVGWWMTFFVVPLGLIGVVGYVFEQSRGRFAH
jgi:uncharacterized membrane protein